MIRQQPTAPHRDRGRRTTRETGNPPWLTALVARCRPSCWPPPRSPSPRAAAVRRPLSEDVTDPEGRAAGRQHRAGRQNRRHVPEPQQPGERPPQHDAAGQGRGRRDARLRPGVLQAGARPGPEGRQGEPGTVRLRPPHLLHTARRLEGRLVHDEGPGRGPEGRQAGHGVDDDHPLPRLQAHERRLAVRGCPATSPEPSRRTSRASPSTGTGSRRSPIPPSRSAPPRRRTWPPR